MSYSFVKVTSYYKEYLKYYYEKYPEIKNASYNEQFTHLMRQEFAMSDYYKQNLEKINVKAYEIVANATDLQKAWAKENNLSAIGKDLVIKQLQSVSPDVVFFQDTSLYNGPWINYLRQQVPSIKKIIGHRCSPYSKENVQLFSYFDFMIACSGEIAEDLKSYGISTYEINHAFESTLVPLIENDNDWPSHNLTFIGSLIEGAGFHSTRKDLLEHLFNQKIELEFYGNIPIVNNLLLKQCTYFLVQAMMKANLRGIINSVEVLKKTSNLTSMPRSFNIPEKIRKNAHPPVFGLDMYRLMNKSNISLNVHGDIASKDAANLRLFEATGAGSCLLTDWKDNITKFFIPDEEIVCYKSIEECVEKIKWLNQNPSKRKEIALKGQKRTLKDHSYYKRAMQLNDIIVKELKNIPNV